jgi:hypothetical protein
MLDLCGRTESLPHAHALIPTAARKGDFFFDLFYFVHFDVVGWFFLFFYPVQLFFFVLVVNFVLD